MRWDAFRQACPEIAERAEERFRRDQLVFLGTVRPDGSARVSPCEVDLVDGELMLGMMWRSQKALDLLRDPRITIHSATSDRTNPDGDVKLRGRVIDVQDPQRRKTFRDAIFARIEWAPDEPGYHLFAVDLERAAYLRFGDESVGLVWDPDHGLQRRTLH